MALNEYVFEATTPIVQLEPKRGSYFVVVIPAETIEQFPNKRVTRLIIELDDQVNYSCGLNHYGDGNFFIIIAKKYLQKLKKEVGHSIHYRIYPDPNPLGVKEPEVLLVLLGQDEGLQKKYNALTDGKKRSLIYGIKGVKNIDLQVEKIMAFLNG